MKRGCRVATTRDADHRSQGQCLFKPGSPGENRGALALSSGADTTLAAVTTLKGAVNSEADVPRIVSLMRFSFHLGLWVILETICPLALDGDHLVGACWPESQDLLTFPAPIFDVNHLAISAPYLKPRRGRPCRLTHASAPNSTLDETDSHPLISSKVWWRENGSARLIPAGTARRCQEWPVLPGRAAEGPRLPGPGWRVTPAGSNHGCH